MCPLSAVFGRGNIKKSRGAARNEKERNVQVRYRDEETTADRFSLRIRPTFSLGLVLKLLYKTSGSTFVLMAQTYN